MIYVFLGMVALLCLVGQSTFFSGQYLHYFRPDSVLAITLFSGFHLSRAPGLVFVFSLGYLADILSGSPDGWNALFMTLVFSLTQVLRSHLFIVGVWTRLVTVLLFSMLKGPCFVYVMNVTGHPLQCSQDMFFHWVGEAMTTSIVTLLLFHFMYREYEMESTFSFQK